MADTTSTPESRLVRNVMDLKCTGATDQALGLAGLPSATRQAVVRRGLSPAGARASVAASIRRGHRFSGDFPVPANLQAVVAAEGQGVVPFQKQFVRPLLQNNKTD
jgi:hypothetical protein